MSEFEHLADTFQATQEALQKHAARAVDSALVVRNWLFGWYLVAFENAAAERSELYGKELINKLSKRLKDKGMKGISPTNLRKFREFYQAYPEIQRTASVTSLTELGSASFLQASAVSQKIQQTASVESSQSMPQVVFKQIASSLPLGWSHYVEVLTIDSPDELESAIIDQLESFLLELGKGFLFEARQKRFTFDNDHFFVDLVFYNRLIRCYILIDLKRDKLTHQDLGQMQMYVNYFDRHVKLPDELPTIGIVLCHRKNDALVELTLPENANIFASKYQLYLPSKEELKARLEQITHDLEGGTP